jgi:hypothetical protein
VQNGGAHLEEMHIGLAERADGEELVAGVGHSGEREEEE